MIPEGYVQALADYADAIQSAAELEEVRDELWATMRKDGKASKVLVNADLNNKQFGFQVSMTVEEKFTAFVEAIKLYNNGTTPMTFAVFPFLHR